ncbi:glycoside hydrolase family 5 protein [Plicaturopsis crispa FD-325 SS-3]|nr:glycoside hydrolase family 5 protein [Plicaturopsis crispa FD-325 SS-3]
MAHIVRPSDNIEYEPLPLTNDNGEITLHEGLPSRNSSRSPSPSPSPPGAGSQTFHTPFEQPGDLPGPSSSPPGSLPLGAGQPRFLGPALLQESTPGIRDSYASSHDAFPSNNSDYDSSVYALNNAGRTGSYAGTYKDDPRMSGYYAGSPGGEGVPMSPVGRSRYLEEKRNTYAPSRTQSKRRLVILGVIAALILLILAVVIPIYFAVIKKGGSSGLSSDGSSTANPTSTSSPAALAAVTGGDGSKVTMDDGSTFTYTNSFGGTWYWDENDPFNNGAQAQSWTPALNETFKYGVDKIRGSVKP